MVSSRIKPLAIDLFCGLGGWTDGLMAENWRVIGFDIEQHVYGEHRYPAQLVIQDVLTLHGSQFRNADLIVASPPCQEYSYMAMPWARAKKIAAEYRSGVRDVKKLTALFDACFRLQREASEAAGRKIPLVVENVRGAIPWVGRSRWNFGSFHLWGDVPALMPSTFRFGPQPGIKRTGRTMCYPAGSINPDAVKGRTGKLHWQDESGQKVPGSRFDGSGKSFQTASVNATMKEGIKQRGSGREWFAGDGKISRLTSSKSPARKAASAMIAKIPLPLSRHIARSFKPAAEIARAA